ncbi:MULTISPECIES: S26 family signal peptidase [Rhodopseudomonas]|uniref:Peptidase S26 n=1 Tax=Rhodopseudomonas palustris TaxID=1076 RepID=A0A0D7F8S3_RHOPL|nr:MULTISPECIES: S26 family signal peptidase [Rhodopseudomonas]KIZ48122.1 peptidase S26 [Rhodopseudomonas palustris]MDF3810754.1 S26 family signal peptidase [Rhodopseudomonas sp. BAL398]WOK20557.1 S26 family signal peptidase [Rhodopseudomonas sp. BAL398]
MTRLAYVMATSFVVLVMIGRSTVTVAPKLIWNASASAPIGLYAVWPAADLGVTDLVAVEAPEPLVSYLIAREYLPRGVPLMKRVAALPGQTVCRSGSSVTIDTVTVGEALPYDRRGHILPVWQGCQTLGPDEIFLMNWDVQDSLDGRYFGPIPKDSVVGRALPLWTDEGGDGRYQWRAPTR